MAELEFGANHDTDEDITADDDDFSQTVAVDVEAERVWLDSLAELQYTMSSQLTMLRNLSHHPDIAVKGVAVAYGFDPDEGRFYALSITGVDGKSEADSDDQ